jgi:DNA replication protein DnaC
VRPVWFYARALAQAARQWPLGEGAAPEVDRASKAGLLVLDDLGLERDAAELVDVLHSRYEHGYVTWTTSGLTMGELKERYGEALVRRLIEGREQSGRVVSTFGRAA